MLKKYQSISRIKILTAPALLFWGVFLWVGLVSVAPVGAQASQQPRIDLNKAAEEFCGDGAIGTAEAACRNGFRKGYNGESIAAACNNRADYSSAEKTGCRKGHAGGKNFKASGGASTTTPFFGSSVGVDTCGEGENAIKTKFNFGCSGKGNPIFDVLFAIIRFLTFGVGIVVVIAIILSGIKYTMSEGNPETTMAAKNQIQNAIIALMIYLFAFALLNFLVPGGLLR